MWTNFPGVDFLGTALKFRKRKKNWSSLVYFLPKTWNLAFSRHSRSVAAEEEWCSCKFVVLLNKPKLLFWCSRCRRRRRCWLPNNSNKGETAVDRYHPALFWVLLVSCSCIAKLIFTKYELQISMCLLGILLLIRSSLRHNSLRSSQNFFLRLQSNRISKSPILFSTLVGNTPLKNPSVVVVVVVVVFFFDLSISNERISI